MKGLAPTDLGPQTCVQVALIMLKHGTLAQQIEALTWLHAQGIR